ncbi:MAG: TonB-dependent receptor plug domain-containing protein [Pseudomonadota bacterium]
MGTSKSTPGGRSRLARLGLLFAVGLPLQGFAAESESRLNYLLSLSLEELLAQEVSISTQSRRKLSKAPSVVTVITAEDIKATGATNLVDVLQGVPGIYVRASQFGFRPLIHFRGAGANQTLLMINGAPMKDLLWGFGIFWKGLPVSAIERIEIIRGPGSALFGSDASAGVINVITWTAGDRTTAEAGVRAGSEATASAWLRHAAAWKDLQVRFSADVFETDGHDPWIDADAQTAQDHRFGSQASLAPGRAHYGWAGEDVRLSVTSGDWQLLADYLRHRDLDIGLTGAGVLDPVTEAGDHRCNLALRYANSDFAPDWGVQAEWRYQDLSYTSGAGFQERPPGYVDASGTYPDGWLNRMRSAERQLNFELSGNYSAWSGHAVRLGMGYQWQDLYEVVQSVNGGMGPEGLPLPPGGPLVDLTGTPYAFAPEKSREVVYAFVQDIWTLSDRLEVTTGARYDRYSDFGDTFNPRLALVWQASDTLTAKLMYGQAFRAPSYQELHAVTTVALPNAELNPETSRTWDLSLAYSPSKPWSLGLDLYHLTLSNLIIATGAPRQYQNVGDHAIRGAELEARWHPHDHLRLSANLSLLRQEDSSYRSLFVPERQAYLRADWRVAPGWHWNAQAHWTSRRPRADVDPRDALEGHTLVDTTLRYAPDEDWEVALSIRNLFDADAREYTGIAIPGDLPLPGRHGYAELRYRF